MSQPTEFRVADLKPNRPVAVQFAPDTAQMKAIAELLGLDGLRKMTLKGELTATGRSDWQFKGHLGATVIQPCVVTLSPVTTRIEEDILRNFVTDWHEPEDNEIEMPEDDTTEPLGEVIDVQKIALEALALALPAYPRAEGAALGEAIFSEPGTDPMSDEDAKPFAALAALKNKLDTPE
ncbi:MAG: DUF177 domain-containing protein [Paracoccaceae bacterium]